MPRCPPARGRWRRGRDGRPPGGAGEPGAAGAGGRSRLGPEGPAQRAVALRDVAPTTTPVSRSTVTAGAGVAPDGTGRTLSRHPVARHGDGSTEPAAAQGWHGSPVIDGRLTAALRGHLFRGAWSFGTSSPTEETAAGSNRSNRGAL